VSEQKLVPYPVPHPRMTVPEAPGILVNLESGATVGAARFEDGGWYLRLESDLKDGNRQYLEFTTSREAAEALHMLLETGADPENRLNNKELL